MVILMTANVYAADIDGDVTVIEQPLRLSDLTAPTEPVSPTTVVPFTWHLSYPAGIGSDPAGMSSLEVDFWHESVDIESPTGPLHYSCIFREAWPSWNLVEPTGWFVGSSPYSWDKVPDNIEPFEHLDDVTELTFQLDVRPLSVSIAGGWTVAVNVIHKVSSGLPDLYEEEVFSLTDYASLTLFEESFSWGTIERNSVNVPIVDPVEGYLSLLITCNNLQTLRIMGTPPTDGVNTIDISNIRIGLTDDPLAAQLMTTVLADFAFYDTETQNIMVFIWISIPIDAELSTYYTTLSFVLGPS